MAFKQEVNVPLIFTIGVVSGIVLLVTVIGTQAWYQSEENIEIAQKTAPVMIRYFGWTRPETCPTMNIITMVTRPPGVRTSPAQVAV